jgi:hypothetical protein
MGTGFLMGINIFHGYGFGTAKPSGFVPVAISAAEPVPKAAGKNMKALTHRSRYIEPAVVPEFGGEASSTAEPRETVLPMQRTEEPAIMPKEPSVELFETKVDKDKAERSKTKEVIKVSGIFSPSTEATALKAQKSSSTTPKRRRMVNVLDVLETTDSISLAPTGKVAEADKRNPKLILSK